MGCLLASACPHWCEPTETHRDHHRDSHCHRDRRRDRHRGRHRDRHRDHRPLLVLSCYAWRWSVLIGELEGLFLYRLHCHSYLQIHCC